jgi:hypothetical protein
MSSNPTNLVSSPQTPTEAVVDLKTGRFNWSGMKWAQGITQAVNNALTILGLFNGKIGIGATVEGHGGTLATAVQHLTPTGQLIASQLTGIIASAQLPAADPAAQGAVVLPTGAPSNVLDTAAFQPITAFDPAGAAAAAQAASDPLGSAAAAQTASEAYTDSKFPGVVAHTIPLAKITTGGTDGSITVNANGVVTGYVDPT